MNRYESTILPNEELEIVLDSTDADGDGYANLVIYHIETLQIVFVGVPIILAAALGGLYEALWKRREMSSAAGPYPCLPSQRPRLPHNVVHYQYRPLGRYAP